MLATIIWTLLTWLSTIIAILLVYNIVSISIIYLKFKHRLKGIPIAAGCSLIDGHIRTFMFKRHFLHDLPKLRDKYGDTFGWLYGTQPAVITHDLDAIKQMILDDKSINKINFNTPVKELEIDSLFTAKGKQWRRIRKTLAPALKSSKFKTPNVQQDIDTTISKLISSIDIKLINSKDQLDNGQRVAQLNLDDLAHRYMLDLVLSCFYKQTNIIDFHSQKDPMVETVVAGHEAMMWNPMMRLTITFPILRPLIDWLMLHFHSQGTWRKLIMQFIKQQTRLNFEARKQMQKLKQLGKKFDEDNFKLDNGVTFKRSMIDYVIDQFHEGKLTTSEYFHSTWFLLEAAVETSAATIIYTIYQLALNQQIQDKLRHSIELEGLESEYLTWVLNESLRIMPQGPLGCSRVAKNDIKLSNGVIPAGTFILTPVFSIHRLRKYWGNDVESFKPERFANIDQFHPFQYIPFGASTRICPGKEFALYEMKKLFCILLARYKFQCEPIENRYNAPFSLFLIPDKKTVVRVTRNND